ncbi:gene transfer agent family protein [Phyllobacterium phragmitis]|uniref:Gene transfer agent family protein n=1 Tax=Phyllobacterium phragmitis TaxID=2670329 RepID=A0ABQ0GYJ9_9HYPH
MNEPLTFRKFFGDAERDFHLTPELIFELERITGTGIGGLSRRVFTGDFRHAELLHVIRLGLIGGGETPEEANSLIEAYGKPRPIAELVPIALGILETVMFGKAKTDGE